MANCDFTTYNTLRDTTRNASTEAQASCAAEETAQAALSDAQAALTAAQQGKTTAYNTWQAAEQAENAEAVRLGIDPNSPAP